ncbi:MAG: NCS2 family permease [Deltaproteobacteria bacterium]|nr:NCS2 family permease [Deltaproteobacteria bacterium]MBI3061976.1 NCS2 family permease [Deltaproteobacteria bacterium]
MFRPPWFVRKDLDGFFGLMIDNLIQLILIVSLCRELIHLPDSYIFGRILPGAAISILLGNFFYSWQARQLARETGREDVTALPYGINTVSLFAYVFFIMLPIYQETKDPVWAWKVGLVACFLNGFIEILGAFIAEKVRRTTPRAALLSALAGIAITFISMDFSFRIFAQPLIAMVPMALIFLSYFSHQRFPLGLPGGLVAILVGTALAWGLGAMSGNPWSGGFGLAQPVFTGDSLWEALWDPEFLKYMSVILPMGIFNVVGSLQNIESAEAAGDRYRTFPSLMANGIGSVAASLFGSAFPTTIYIGHPGWKRLGARSGYSALNGIFITLLCLTGTIQTVLRFIPLEAGIGILLYIGIIIVAQSFQETPKEHALAVAVGLFPALAAWGLLMVETGLKAGGKSLYEAGLAPFAQSLAIHGMISLERGFIFTSMILAAIGVFLIEREFFRAAFWSLAAAVFAAIGIIHAYELTPGGVATRFGFLASPEFTVSYLLLFVLFLAVGWWERK